MSVGEDIRILRQHGDRLVRPGDADHAVNVLAGGPPSWLTRALADADVSTYPDDTAARAAVASLHERTPDEVLITNGASEALWLLGPALTPRLAALLQPGFTETEAALRAHRVTVQRCFDPTEIPEDADLVVVTNPSSPDGALRSAADLDQLRAPGRTLVVDEAFMSMVPGELHSVAALPHPDVIVIRSLTKLLSVPGLRVGYALAPATLTARLSAVRPPWSANALALVTLTAAAAHRHELSALACRAATERADLVARLANLDVPGLTIHPSQTNFVLIEVENGPVLTDALRKQAIAVRPCGSFPGFSDDQIRITARDPQANARLVAAIAEVLTCGKVTK